MATGSAGASPPTARSGCRHSPLRVVRELLDGLVREPERRPAPNMEPPLQVLELHPAAEAEAMQAPPDAVRHVLH